MPPNTRQADAELREQVLEAMLAACGELGYRKVSVQAVIDRYGGHRAQFYSLFANKADCYAAAHAHHSKQLCEAMLGAGAKAGTWQSGLEAALSLLGRFVVEKPLVARGLLVEVHVAGGPALVQRQAMFERLSRAIDRARRETGSRHSPPPLTAAFMVAVIDAAVTRALSSGEVGGFAQEVVPDLAWITVIAYLGQSSAAQSRESLQRA